MRKKTKKRKKRKKMEMYNSCIQYKITIAYYGNDDPVEETNYLPETMIRLGLIMYENEWAYILLTNCTTGEVIANWCNTSWLGISVLENEEEEKEND